MHKKSKYESWLKKIKKLKYSNIQIFKYIKRESKKAKNKFEPFKFT